MRRQRIQQGGSFRPPTSVLLFRSTGCLIASPIGRPLQMRVIGGVKFIMPVWIDGAANVVHRWRFDMTIDERLTRDASTILTATTDLSRAVSRTPEELT